MLRSSCIAHRPSASGVQSTTASALRACSRTNLTITAWQDDLLIGISRCISDFAWTTYLADLAVRASHQHRGIGKELIRRTQAAAPQAKLLLLAAPAAENYYPHIGFSHFPQAWMLRENESLG
jgi:predicted N-acetyltransferase YhbS